MTFGIVKSSIEQNLIDAYGDQLLFKKMLKEFKSNVLDNKNMSTLYDLYSQLTTPQGLSDNDAKEYLEEGVRLIQSRLKKSKLPVGKLNETDNNYGDLDLLVYGSTNIMEILEAKRRLVNVLKSNKGPNKEIISLPIESMIKIAEQTFKSYLKEIPAVAKSEFIKLFTLSESELKSKYEKDKIIAINKLQQLSEEKDNETKEMIQTTITKIVSETFNHYNYIKLKNLIESI